MKTQIRKTLVILTTGLLLVSCVKEKKPVIASFPGGQGSFSKYLSTNIKYPESARKNSLSGIVYVGYTITETGKIENVHVVKGVAPALDSEAVRVVSSMPDWIPAEGKNGPVSSQLFLPINFQLK